MGMQGVADCLKEAFRGQDRIVELSSFGDR